MKSELQKQRDFIAMLDKEQLPCPNCGEKFSKKGNEFGTQGEMAKCPSCGIVWKKALSLFGETWWTPITDMQVIEQEYTRLWSEYDSAADGAEKGEGE